MVYKKQTAEGDRNQVSTSQISVNKRRWTEILQS